MQSITNGGRTCTHRLLGIEVDVITVSAVAVPRAVRLELPILALIPGLRQRCVAPGV